MTDLSPLPSVVQMKASTLTDEDRAILRAGLLPAQDRLWAAQYLGMSVPRLLQRFVLLIDEPAAAIAEPLIVAQARALGSQRRRQRRRVD